MANNNKMTTANVDGMYIYRDEKGRAIYSGPFMKNEGYIIGNSDLQKLAFYNSKSLIAVVIMIAVIIFIPDKWYAGIGLSLIVYGVLTYMFHNKFLSTLSKTTKFNKTKKNNYFQKMADTKPTWQIVTFILGCILFGVLVYINAKTNSYTGILLYTNYALAAAAIIFGLVNIYTLTLKKK